MNVTKWLKMILYSPLWLFGIVGVDPDAGTDTHDTSTAEETGNPGEETAGADTLNTDSAEDRDSEADETTEGQEANAGTEETKDKGAHQTTLEERAAQIAEKKVAEAMEKLRLERETIERETAERLKAQEKPFVDLTEEQAARLNDDYTSAVVRVAELQELIRLGDRTQETVTELRKAEKWIRETEAWYADNEAKKTAWQKEQKEAEARRLQIAEQSQRLEITAETFRVHHKIPQDVWDASSKWFAEQLRAQPLLAEKFRDAFRRGNVEAVEFAHNYCVEHMGKKEETLLEQKKKAKEALAPAMTGHVKASKEDLAKLLKAAQDNPDDEEKYLAYCRAKRGEA